MATRTIITSQPDVACYVCERRLLRGEQPEVFLAGGQPRTVCELCAPRAAHAGWLREADGDAVSVAPLRARRGRNLFERLRKGGRGADAAPGPAGRGLESRRGRSAREYDFLGGESGSAAVAEPIAEPVEDVSSDYPGVPDDPQPSDRQQPGRQSGRPSSPAAAPNDAAPSTETALSREPGPSASAARSSLLADSPAGLLERALDVFNAGEYPRRVAGLARSLGTPEVSVRAVEGIPNVVAIVVAWELCWYRYRVDLDEDPVQASAHAQGTELSELAREERRPNAAADEFGSLSLPGAAGAYA